MIANPMTTKTTSFCQVHHPPRYDEMMMKNRKLLVGILINLLYFGFRFYRMKLNQQNLTNVASVVLVSSQGRACADITRISIPKEPIHISQDAFYSVRKIKPSSLPRTTNVTSAGTFLYPRLMNGSFTIGILITGTWATKTSTPRTD